MAWSLDRKVYIGLGGVCILAGLDDCHRVEHLGVDIIRGVGHHLDFVGGHGVSGIHNAGIGIPLSTSLKTAATSLLYDLLRFYLGCDVVFR